MNRLFRFQYFTGDKFPLLHQVRDLAIFAELTILLYQKGYLYEDSFLNYPKMINKDSLIPKFEENDLMILTTRPPLSDQHHKRIIYRTDHVYEKAMLKQIGTCFMSLSRHVMFLNRKLALKLREGFENRASISFYVHRNKSNSSAGYKEIAEFGHGVERSYKKWKKFSVIPRSCAFLIFMKAEGILPNMLYIFGIGGQEGLFFSRILKNGLWDTLKVDLNGPSRIIMVEMDIPIPERYPTSLNFVNNLNYEVILNTELD